MWILIKLSVYDRHYFDIIQIADIDKELFEYISSRQEDNDFIDSLSNWNSPLRIEEFNIKILDADEIITLMGVLGFQISYNSCSSFDILESIESKILYNKVKQFLDNNIKKYIKFDLYDTFNSQILYISNNNAGIDNLKYIYLLFQDWEIVLYLKNEKIEINADLKNLILDYVGDFTYFEVDLSAKDKYDLKLRGSSEYFVFFIQNRLGCNKFHLDKFSHIPSLSKVVGHMKKKNLEFAYFY